MQDENNPIVQYNPKMLRFSGVMAGVSFSMILLLASKTPLDVPLTMAMWAFSFLLPFHAATFLRVKSMKETEKESEVKEEADLSDTLLNVNFILSCLLFVLGIGFVIYHISKFALIAYLFSIADYLFVSNKYKGMKVPQSLKNYLKES